LEILFFFTSQTYTEQNNTFVIAEKEFHANRPESQLIQFGVHLALRNSLI
jgi:hypothetical protein